MDKIRICDLRLPVIIGTLEHERKFPQNVTVNVELAYDMRKAGQSDNLFDAVDYSAVERRIIEFVSQSSFHLLEALAEHAPYKQMKRSYRTLDEVEQYELVRELLAPHLNTLYVTAKDIDASVNRLSVTVSDAINLALKEDS